MEEVKDASYHAMESAIRTQNRTNVNIEMLGFHIILPETGISQSATRAIVADCGSMTLKSIQGDSYRLTAESIQSFVTSLVPQSGEKWSIYGKGTNYDYIFSPLAIFVDVKIRKSSEKTSRVPLFKVDVSVVQQNHPNGILLEFSMENLNKLVEIVKSCFQSNDTTDFPMLTEAVSSHLTGWSLQTNSLTDETLVKDLKIQAPRINDKLLEMSFETISMTMRFVDDGKSLTTVAELPCFYMGIDSIGKSIDFTIQKFQVSYRDNQQANVLGSVIVDCDPSTKGIFHLHLSETDLSVDDDDAVKYRTKAQVVLPPFVLTLDFDVITKVMSMVKEFSKSLVLDSDKMENIKRHSQQFQTVRKRNFCFESSVEQMIVTLKNNAFNHFGSLCLVGLQCHFGHASSIYTFDFRIDSFFIHTITETMQLEQIFSPVVSPTATKSCFLSIRMAYNKKGGPWKTRLFLRLQSAQFIFKLGFLKKIIHCLGNLVPTVVQGVGTQRDKKLFTEKFNKWEIEPDFEVEPFTLVLQPTSYPSKEPVAANPIIFNFGRIVCRNWLTLNFARFSVVRMANNNVWKPIDRLQGRNIIPPCFFTVNVTDGKDVALNTTELAVNFNIDDILEFLNCYYELSDLFQGQSIGDSTVTSNVAQVEVHRTPSTQVLENKLRNQWTMT